MLSRQSTDKSSCRRRHGQVVVVVVACGGVVDRSIGWVEVADLPARRLHAMNIRNKYNDRSYLLLKSCVVSRRESERCSSSSGFPAISWSLPPLFEVSRQKDQVKDSSVHRPVYLPIPISNSTEFSAFNPHLWTVGRRHHRKSSCTARNRNSQVATRPPTLTRYNSRQIWIFMIRTSTHGDEFIVSLLCHSFNLVITSPRNSPRGDIYWKR